MIKGTKNFRLMIENGASG